jgi:hypothetical protein
MQAELRASGPRSAAKRALQVSKCAKLVHGGLRLSNYPRREAEETRRTPPSTAVQKRLAAFQYAEHAAVGGAAGMIGTCHSPALPG